MSSEQPKTERHELNHEMRELILTFQKIRLTQDENEQLELIEEFRIKLLDIVTPDGEDFPNDDPRRLRKIMDQEDDFTGYISIATGTDGQRIWLRDHIRVMNEEEAERLGKGAKMEKFEDILDLESADGRPRWLQYNRPSGNSWPIGKPYWERYVEKFGGEIVDLLQEIK